MSASLTGSFDVRQGEGVLVARSTITLFGLIAAHTMLETARDALFLGELTAARLPLVYVLLAGLSLVVAKANTRFVEGFGRRNVLVITLLAAAYGTILLFLIPSSKAAIFSLYVWSALLGTVMVVQFWMYCGHLFTVAQGSRLFGLVTAGGVLGAVTGAATSVLLLRVLPVKALLLVSAGIFLATALHLTGLHVDAPDAPSKRKRADPEEPRGFGRFQHHPYVVRIAVLIAISTAAVLVTDYLFKSAAVRYYDRDQLGGFFATYYAILNAVALGVQVFIASRLVDRAGVIAAFVVLPVLLMAGGLGTLLLGGTFAGVLLTKGADGSLRHSLHRIATELLWLPVPDRVRAESKAFVDTVVMRAAQAIAAGALLVLGMFDVESIRIFSAIVAGLALLWIGFAFALRGPYLDLFRSALNRSAPTAKRIQLDLNSVEVVVEKLSSRDKVETIAAIDLLAASNRSRLIPALILYHEHEEVLIRALEVIATRGRRDWIALAERLLDHRSPKVRVAALKALASQLEDKKSIEGRMLDISPYVRAHAAFWLAHLDRDLAPIQDPAVAQIMEMGEFAAATDAQVGLLEAIRAGGDGRWIDVISTLAASDNPQVMEAAVLAIEKVRSEGFIPLLIQRLGVREGRDVVREAIVGLGEPALVALEKALSDPTTPHQIARHIPRTISRFGTQRAADILTDKLFTTESGAVRFKVLRGLGRMVVERPVRVDRDKIEQRLAMELQEYLRLQALAHPIESNLDKMGEAEMSGRLLVGLLSNKMDQALERIFRLLQIAHRSEDIRSAWFAARSGDKRMRAQAHEFLSALTLTSVVPENREMLRIVVDDLPVDERIKRAADFVPNAPVSHRAAVLRLLEDDDEALAGIATYHGLHIGGLKNEVINLSKGSPLWKQVKAMLEGISGLREVPSVA